MLCQIIFGDISPKCKCGDNFASDSLDNRFISTVWSTSFPTATGTAKPATVTVGTGTTFTLNGVTVGIADSDSINTIAQKINNKFHTVDGGGGIGAKNLNGALAIYVDAAKQSSVTIAGSTDMLTQLGFSAQSYTVPTVFVGPHTQYPDFSTKASGSIYLKTTSPNEGAAWVVKQWSATAGAWNTVKSPVYSSVAAATYTFDKTGGGANIPVGTVFVESNYDHGDNSSTSTAIIANYKLYRRAAVSPTAITSAAKAPTTALISTSTFQIETT